MNEQHTTPACKTYAMLVFWLALPLAVSALGAFFTVTSIDNWYATLRKPSWTPPNQVFGPVWTALYLMMGFAAWLVWRKQSGRSAALPLLLFVNQLFLNALWSPLFFGFHRPGVALADLLLLWPILALTMLVFFRSSKAAGYLLLPYLLWTTFATALNAAIFIMNR